MEENTKASKLAQFFDRQREIIEAAETPFSKLVIFVLPVVAPIVPASLTGLHLYKLFLEVFTFKGAEILSATLAIIVAMVLEMLGYVGAISFIQAVFRFVKSWNKLYLLPAILNGLAYGFYLALMYMVNYMLGQYFHTPDIINNIVGLLSFVTVPTGLLAANHLSQKEIKEDDRELRKENREERLERARIKAGKVSGKLPVSSESAESYQKVSSNLPTDWRKVRPRLSKEQVMFIAQSEPKVIVETLSESGLNISPRTASNWHTYAMDELQVRINSH